MLGRRASFLGELARLPDSINWAAIKNLVDLRITGHTIFNVDGEAHPLIEEK